MRTESRFLGVVYGGRKEGCSTAHAQYYSCAYSFRPLVALIPYNGLLTWLHLKSGTSALGSVLEHNEVGHYLGRLVSESARILGRSS